MRRAPCATAIGPCRVDLAGGTLDIWPLGQLFPGASTVSVAVDLPVTIRVCLGGRLYRARLGDQLFEGSTAAELAALPRAALVGLVLGTLEMPPCEVEVHSGSPVGAGLGASSTVTLGLLAACRAVTGRPEADDRVCLARDLEARLMGLPTGVQDHITAESGGVVVIEHRAGGPLVRPLAMPLAELSRRLLVVDSGRSHLSARSNWEVVRGCLDGEPGVRAALAGIAAVAGRMVAALESSSWEVVGGLMRQEWLHRRQLGSGVSTPQIETLLDVARQAGAHGGKVCGAGGGGCVALLCPPDRRSTIASRLAAAGGIRVEAVPTPLGLRVEIGAANG